MEAVDAYSCQKIDCGVPAVCSGICCGRNYYTGLSCGKDSPKEMFSLPFQQTARYVKEYGDEISEEEREIIAKVLDYDSLAEIYEPMTADPVKQLIVLVRRGILLHISRCG